ncbi:MAG: stage 0 sporulation family protein [Oscillospiraceae bacterium]|nr:stage 0 sporulation family protein [Oscillospiraceae bacterium]
MKKIIGVRFRGAGKSYYFDPQQLNAVLGDMVIVETARGIECGEVMIGPKEVDEKELVHPLKNALRLATQEDLKKVAENREKEKDALVTCGEKIAQHDLEMKLVDVEYTFDGSKIIFYFTADGRVDFRELVKDLAGVFRTRIELRQIGVRDESKMLGGIGICGRQFCCSKFLFDFSPVSIKMAKEQGMSLNPVKISGCCGRLMCCLKYEEDLYEELIKVTPKNGTLVNTPEGEGTVVDSNLMTGAVKVRMKNLPDAPPRTYAREELRTFTGEKGASPRKPKSNRDRRQGHAPGD